MKIDPREGIPVKAKGIPAIALVTEYIPGKSWRDYNFPGSGPGDCEPPEPADIDWELYDRKGYRAVWLEEQLSDVDSDRIRDALLNELEG